MTDEDKPLPIAVIGAGALPAAVMALVIHGGFEMLNRVLIPRGLRLSLNRAL